MLHWHSRHGIAVETLPVEEMSEVRIYDSDRRVILSEALDFQNRTFQLAHVIGVESDVL